MATNTYVALDKVTVGTATSSITFSSINQGYTDLVLVVDQGNDQNTDYDVYVRFNSDSGSNYSRTQLVGNGTTASSSRSSNNTELRMGPSINNTPTSMLTLNIMNYSNSTTYKTTLLRTGQASAYTTAAVGLWRSTAAITSVVFTLQGGYNFVSGSTFSLYAIKAEGAAVAKATGGTITSDVGYIYHTFTASGNFVPSVPLTCDIFAIGGGGGAGGGNAGGTTWGGGGASGIVRSTSAVSLTTTTAVTIGAGGTGGPSAFNGSSTTVSAITATGGGSTSTGSNGASNADYSGATTSNQYGAGGAGAAAGGSGNNGGSGSGAFAAWALTTGTGSGGYYGGGGAGAYNGGAGSGGAGGGGGWKTNGATNTGSGGGAWDSYYGQTSGGSGLVIVRYAR